ncbi:MAG: hypothetical protein Q9220_004502 [cf. Caloplaca sp. 1 TL-2023]
MALQQDQRPSDGTIEPMKAHKHTVAQSRVSLSRSPPVSDTSDEVIVFEGRRSLRRGTLPEKTAKSETLPSNKDRLYSRDDRTSDSADVAATSSFAGISDRRPAHGRSSLATRNSCGTEIPTDELENLSSTVLRGNSRFRHRQKQRAARSMRQKEEEERILADYIANMADEDGSDDILESSVPTETHREVFQSATGLDVIVEKGTAEDALDDPLNDVSEWDSTNIRDFDGLSTSTECDSGIIKVLSKRQRRLGEQYLVVGEGQSTDEARWMPLTFMTSPSARRCIQAFELVQAGLNIDSHSDEDSDDADTAKIEADVQEDLDDLEDERDLLERKQAMMTDGQIARLLAKQEELGLGSSELLLFDGDDEIDQDHSQAGQSGAVYIKNHSSIKTSGGRKSSKRAQQYGAIPSSSSFSHEILVDAYGDFDVMDRDRPSLRRTPKGRSKKLMLALSDSELEASIQSAWEKDRSKKKVRKQERENLRAQGILGETGQPHLQARYREGISLQSVQDEIRQFMTSAYQSLALPPMAHHERKMVHEMANRLRLGSKSSGVGKGRYPVLYRHRGTGEFDPAAFSKLDTVFNSRSFLPRKEVRGPRKSARVKQGAVARGNTAGVSYQDGEVVGAAAPELGQENRGRAMLEKMGWSKGTALGASNNKGMLQPVTHVVKTTKAGLG